MPDFRWKDPRNGRIWEVGGCSLGSVDGGALRSVVCFETTGTPRAGHSVACCRGVHRRLPALDDQALALCLDAARDGGYLWVDPRDDSLWWVRENGHGEPARLRFVGSTGELDVASAAHLPPSRPESLMSLRDQGRPRTAA